MDNQFLVAVNIMVFSALIIAFAVSQRGRHVSLNALAVHVVVLALGGLALALGWSQPGTMLAAVFLPFVIVPGVLLYVSQRRSNMAKPAAAAAYAKWASFFSPTPDLRYNARLLDALAINDTAACVAKLSAIRATCDPQRTVGVDALIFRVQDDWAGVLDVIRSAPEAADALCALRVRALGELGRCEEMVAAYQSSRTRLAATELAQCHLFILAFTGQEQGLAHYVDNPRIGYDAETKAYWKAVAALRSRRDAGAEHREMQTLATASQRTLTRLAASRHVGDAAEPARRFLSEPARSEVERINARVLRDAPQWNRRLKTSPITLTMILANTAMFGVELYRGGEEDLSILYELGAMWPPAILQSGEWWRLLTATFLHFGWLHIAVNMASLSALGVVVEARAGWWRMALMYLIGGIGSSAAVLALMNAKVLNEGVLIGASGAVMALFGAMAAMEFRKWRTSRDILDRRGFLALPVILIVQIATDMIIPEVSLAAHLSGFVIGAIVALIVGEKGPAKPA